ncbi:MAG: methyltransferase domain-containing protein [Thermodesulfovibrionales bacterium]
MVQGGAGLESVPAVRGAPPIHERNLGNLRRYRYTAPVYDILDFPWELQYRKWRPGLVGDLRGEVLEAGVGTGRNLPFYHPDVALTALDLSEAMLGRARRRARDARCRVSFVRGDACRMEAVPSGRYDWVVATFLCCVLPDELQRLALDEFARVLRPGGRFRLLEMMYSEDASLRRRQDIFAPLVERLYGARFDRNTLTHVEAAPKLKITGTRHLKHDVYLLIEGVREA